MSDLSLDGQRWWVWGPSRVCRVEFVARWHGGCCQPSLAGVLKPASAHDSLRNVTFTRFLGNHVTLRLVECAGAGVGVEG